MKTRFDMDIETTEDLKREVNALVKVIAQFQDLTTDKEKENYEKWNAQLDALEEWVYNKNDLKWNTAYEDQVENAIEMYNLIS